MHQTALDRGGEILARLPCDSARWPRVVTLKAHRPGADATGASPPAPCPPCPPSAPAQIHPRVFIPPPTGTCDTWVNRRLESDPTASAGSTGSGGEDCSQIPWLRWSGGPGGSRGGQGGSPIVNIWTFVGNVGVTLMIFQSGMHIHFDKVAQVGRKAFVVAVFGTALPLLTGMVVVGGLTGEYYPSGFAAGCAFAPTSIDISIKLLDESKMLNSLAGQTTLTAACIGLVGGPPQWCHSSASVASCCWLSRLRAALRTRDEPPSRSGPHGRLWCGRVARPKPLILRRPNTQVHRRHLQSRHARDDDEPRQGRHVTAQHPAACLLLLRVPCTRGLPRHQSLPSLAAPALTHTRLKVRIRAAAGANWGSTSVTALPHRPTRLP